jgi:hypothetical protein
LINQQQQQEHKMGNPVVDKHDMEMRNRVVDFMCEHPAFLEWAKEIQLHGGWEGDEDEDGKLPNNNFFLDGREAIDIMLGRILQFAIDQTWWMGGMIQLPAADDNHEEGA